MISLIIIDTGCANLSSVKFAFDRLGYRAEITRDIHKIQSADKLLLPGVGTAMAAIRNLQERNLIDCIRKATQPMLGICLGMDYTPDHPLFAGIEQDSHFYFVHSYAVQPNENTIATSCYGVDFSAAIANKNFYGVQFHPERSGKNGALLLRNFVEKVK